MLYMHGQNVFKNYRMKLKRVVWTFILLCTCVLGIPICMHDHMPDMQAYSLKESCLKASLTIKKNFSGRLIHLVQECVQLVNLML